MNGWNFIKQFALVFLVGTLIAIVGCGSPLRLSVEDSVGPTGEKVRLVGKLGYRGIPAFDEGLHEKDLNFFVAGRFIGANKTNDEGYASIKHRFDKVGVVRFHVTADDHRRRWAEGEGRAFVWDKDDPVLVVDIDGTICRTDNWALVTEPRDARSAAMGGAPEALNELAKHFRIVYLTARPREYIEKTSQWLNDHDFPLGPVLTWDLEKHPWSPADYKRKRIDQLQDDFKNVTIGIGNTDYDYEVYKKRKLFAVLIDPGKPTRKIDRGLAVPDWNALLEVFNRNSKLYEQKVPNKDELILP